MAVATMTRCGGGGGPAAADECGLGTLERVRYFQRQLLTADDMRADQDYFRQKMRRHNRLLHGWGVVCGLGVSAAPTKAEPWRVRIAEGFALSPQGDEIYVPDDTYVDLARCGPGVVTDPCDPGRLRDAAPAGARGVVFVAVRYAECLTRPVRGGAGCGCDDIACEYSRVRDSFEASCLSELPRVPEGPGICELHHRALVPCPPCPEEPWVVVARVVLPASVEDKVDMIQPLFHRVLYSTQAIQDQLIRCCCGDDETPAVPVRVSAVTPAAKQEFNDKGPAVATVTFDKDVEAATVDAQTVLLTVTNDKGEQQTVPSSVTYAAATRTATLKPQKSLSIGDYTLRVLGAGAKHVTDVDSLALDGNKDGTGGDDFTSTFRVVPSPPA